LAQSSPLIRIHLTFAPSLSSEFFNGFMLSFYSMTGLSDPAVKDLAWGDIGST
jgi:hypothetical protein